MWLAASETLVLMLSVYVGLMSALIIGSNSSIRLTENTAIASGIFTVIMLLAMIATGLYRRENTRDISAILLKVTLSFMIGFGLLTLLYFTNPTLFIETNSLPATLICAFTGVVCTRLMFRRVCNLSHLNHNILVIGTGDRARKLESMIQSGQISGVNIVTNLRPTGELADQILSKNIIHDSSRLCRIVEEHNVSEIVVAQDDRRGTFAADDILSCKMAGIPVTNLVGFLEKQTGSISLADLNPSHIIFSDGFRHTKTSQWGKRLFDILSSVGLLVASLPIMLAAALAIWIESGGKGPILYRQERVGKLGKKFSMLKFRSMQTDAEASGKAQWAKENDQRVTRVGRFIRKTRIDELPQLFNVIRGEMSFVGPRPERPQFVEQLSEIIPYYNLRHSAKPGITGWAQVCYPYGASADDARKKLQYDLYYLKNYSLFLDFTILLQTAQVCIWGNGAR